MVPELVTELFRWLGVSQSAGMVALWALVGLLVTIALGELFFPWLAVKIDNEFDRSNLPDEGKIDREMWKKLLTRPPGGKYLGRVERLIFFCSLLADGWPLIVAWLVFKVATNWQWARNINAIPDWLLQHKNPRYLAVRMLWGSRAVVSFTCGTGATWLSLVAGADVARARVVMLLWTPAGFTIVQPSRRRQTAEVNA